MGNRKCVSRACIVEDSLGPQCYSCLDHLHNLQLPNTNKPFLSSNTPCLCSNAIGESLCKKLNLLIFVMAGLIRPAPVELPQDRKVARVDG